MKKHAACYLNKMPALALLFALALLIAVIPLVNVADAVESGSNAYQFLNGAEYVGDVRVLMTDDTGIRVVSTVVHRTYIARGGTPYYVQKSQIKKDMSSDLIFNSNDLLKYYGGTERYVDFTPRVPNHKSSAVKINLDDDFGTENFDASVRLTLSRAYDSRESANKKKTASAASKDKTKDKTKKELDAAKKSTKDYVDILIDRGEYKIGILRVESGNAPSSISVHALTYSSGETLLLYKNDDTGQIMTAEDFSKKYVQNAQSAEFISNAGKKSDINVGKGTIIYKMETKILNSLPEKTLKKMGVETLVSAKKCKAPV